MGAQYNWAERNLDSDSTKLDLGNASGRNTFELFAFLYLGKLFFREELNYDKKEKTHLGL